ncbi:MAG: Dihydrolipoyl dehydrogenase [Alphaproteobacteria bacterium ADurb.Bin438]|nr:MAG: Dihydrolipoyl dehydrogenase [Alphaproteobacteria bacterium ADurb.Bin438]
MEYDIAIIGGGPAGYAGAIKAAKLGLKTILFEKEHLGGICLNYGCIPTKALLKSAITYRKAKDFEKLGLSAENLSYNLEKVVKRSRDISSRLAMGVAFLLKKNGVEVVNSHAIITGNNEITANETKYNCKNIIIATGAKPRSIPNVEIDGEFIVNYKEAMLPKSIPARLTIIGSGAIGMEFAEIYSSLGSKITVIEAMDRIMPNEEVEVSDTMKRILTKRGYEFITSGFVKSITKENDIIKTVLEDSKEIISDKVLVAIGVTGNIQNIGLENIGIETFKGHVKTDDFFKTNIPNIYAVGDVASPPYLAHKASHEAIKCVELICGKTIKPIDKNNIPFCTYTSPQVASFGVKQGKVGKFPMLANGKALTSGENDGFIKAYVDETNGKVIGATMVGEEVTELLSTFLALNNNDVEELMLAHPTLSESISEAILSASGNAIHI